MNHSSIFPILLEDEVSRFTFLIASASHHVLIDAGARFHSSRLIKGLEEQGGVSQLDYIILQSNDFLNVTSIEDLLKQGFKGTLIVNESSIPFLKNIVGIKIKTINQLEFHLDLDGLNLEFITTPFLPYPECFVTYLKREKTLFSGHLFSMFPPENDEDNLLNRINRFHEQTLPSSDFVRHSFKKFKTLEIETIYPRLGQVISGELVKTVLEGVSSYDFYNTSQVVEKKSGKRFNFNYEEICNHMLRKLSSTKRRNAILSVFKDSEIKVQAYPGLEIASTTLTGYRLWNRFFEIIYEKKGIEWLVLLEPTVKKYGLLYQIKKPAIYDAIIFQQKTEIETLSNQKDDLEEKVRTLRTKIDETTDRLLRCPITGLHNQVFMTQHLLDNINKPLPTGFIRALLVIHIDNLLTINKKYGAIKGDDTLRSLVHVVNQVKQEDTLVFKQNGPGIFVYKHEVKAEDLMKFALTLKNTIRKSDLFIEPITISISVVETSELNHDYQPSDQVSQLVELSLSRLERARLKGKDQLLDKDNDHFEYREGVILLVDEDETNQNLMMTIFKRINYDVMIASDIYQAYDIIENNTIDIIISEINLSKLDGFQLKQKLNASKDYKAIPFLIVSHHKNLNVITRCNLLDVDLVLQKPIIPEELIGHVKRLKERRVHL